MPNNKLSKQKEYKRIKGFRDILPQDQLWWDRVFDVVRKAAENGRFARLIVPILEETALYKRSIGKETDIVSKEMYTFIDPGERDVALRPEFTAGMVRAYIEHGMVNQPQPVKVYDVGPLFRHDNPQRGRFRQFWQFNFEVFGEIDPIIDAQVIRIAHGILQELGLSVTVLINSIGCRECRPVYLEELIKSLKGSRKLLCDDCKTRLARNPLRVLDCKEDGCKEIAKKAPDIIDGLCDTCKTHFMQVLEYLDEFEITYDLTPRLVRGLDYYTRTTFEIVLQDVQDHSQSALLGGGRYDYLVEDMGGRETPSIGFAGGIDRIIDAMKAADINLSDPSSPEIFVAQLGIDARKAAFQVYADLQTAGIKVAEAFSKTGLKQQLEYSNKIGVLFTLILGQKELSDKTIIIRDMESGIQEVIDVQKVVVEVKKRLAAKHESLKNDGL